MTLQPSRLKYRKNFRGKMPGNAVRGNKISFGEYGLKALTRGWVTSNQIEAARVTMSRRTRKGGKVWIRIFPHKPITSKPNEIGMGGGKGDVSNYVAVVKPGSVLFEISGITDVLAHEALIQAGHKLSLRTKIVKR